MILKPMVRNNICINSHPVGCARVVRDHIEKTRQAMSGGKSAIEAQKAAPAGTPKLALIIGCSTGYGLASRVAAAFGYGAATVGISFEKPGSASKPGTPGWYNNLTFEREAATAGLPSVTLDGDAFSGEMKSQAAEAIRATAAKAEIDPKVDLIVYSLASPVRTDPSNGVTYRSVIKPIGQVFSGRTVDMMSGRIINASAEPATEDEIAQTVKVMGGEDWELWIKALADQGLLSSGVRTVAYTYLGPELSWAIYKNGTIGKAKEDLERAAKAINAKLGSLGAPDGRAWISVNKALVTRASVVIPIIPFYVSCLYKIMKERGVHEGCMEQIIRLYRERLYRGESAADPLKVPADEAGRIRIDDLEMRADIQEAVASRMEEVTEENMMEKTDLAGFRHDFMEAHGFDVPGIDYEADVDPSTIQ